MSTSFLVTGATGKQGGAAITALLNAKSSSTSGINEIRFITRNPASASASALVNRGAKACQADFTDAQTLKDALQGVQRAFLMTDAMAGEEKEAAQGKNFIDVAKAAGVEHIVLTSVCAADIATTVPHFRSKYEVEKHLKASGLSYTILRPVAFMNNFPPQAGMPRARTIGLLYASAAFKSLQFIAVEDIGVFAGKALLSPEASEFKNTTIDIASGDYTLQDVRTAITNAQGGQQPWIVRYPTFIRRWMPNNFRQMMYFFQETGQPLVDVEKLRKIHPGLLSLEDWLKKGLKSA